MEWGRVWGGGQGAGELRGTRANQSPTYPTHTLSLARTNTHAHRHLFSLRHCSQRSGCPARIGATFSKFFFCITFPRMLGKASTRGPKVKYSTGHEAFVVFYNGGWWNGSKFAGGGGGRGGGAGVWLCACAHRVRAVGGGFAGKLDMDLKAQLGSVLTFLRGCR